MKTILVPIDFSKNSINALKFACAFAKKEKAKLILLHSHQLFYANPEVPVEFISEQLASLAKAAEKKLVVLSEKITQQDHIPCTYLIPEGETVNVICDVIKKKKIDWVMMGTKGASGVKKMVLGSVAAKVMTKAICPVIAIPEKAVYKGMKKITYATNYRDCDVSNLKQLIEIAKMFKARITLLHVADESYPHSSERTVMAEFKSKIKKAVSYPDIAYDLIFGKEVIKKMDEYIQTKTPNLLVMATQQKNILGEIFWGSTTKRMAFHTTVPLMAFHFKTK